MSDLILPGNLNWSYKDMMILARIDRLSVTKRCKVMQLAVVASTGSVKSLRAAMATIFDRAMDCAIDVYMKGEGKPAKSPFSAWSQEGGYHFIAHRLAYDQVHAVFWSRSTSLLLDDSDQALWANLKSSRFTTPLLREWLPYIKLKLDTGGFLEPCANCNCNCCLLTAQTSDLDMIVESGIKSGDLQIRDFFKEEVA